MLILESLDEAASSHLFHVQDSSSVNYEAALNRLKAEVDPNASLTLRPPREENESLQAIVRGSWSGTIYLHPSTAEVLGSREETEGVMGILFALHSHLFAGEVGKLVLTLSAFAYVLMFLSGVYLWWPVRSKKALSIHWTAGSLRALFDWHRVTGAIFGIVVLLSVVSGAYMAWPPIAKSVTKLSGETFPLPPVVDGGPPKPETVNRAVSLALAEFPDAMVGYVQIPSESDLPIRVRLRLPDDPHPNGMTSVWMDPDSAEVLVANRWSDLDSGTRAYSYLYPLHTGDLGGLPWTVLTFIAGVLLIGYVITGLMLWLRRRRRINHCFVATSR